MEFLCILKAHEDVSNSYITERLLISFIYGTQFRMATQAVSLKQEAIVKYFNDSMAIFVFVLSVICLTTSQRSGADHTEIDFVVAWMGVVCFSVYSLREVLKKFRNAAKTT
jgi:hypothetical protein